MSTEKLRELADRFPAAAEYLSNLALIERDYGSSSNSRIAAWMQVSAPAVTQSIGRLRKLGLVVQEPYGDVRLTKDGMELARQVLRRHYLLEHLLVRMLNFPWDKADEEAKVLQSHLSEDLVQHLDDTLGNPLTCPHGNPLPGTAGEAKLLATPNLASAPNDQELVIARITEEGESIPGMLSACHLADIRPGAKVTIVSRNQDSLVLKLQKNPHYQLPKLFALHIRYWA